jgi:hypothetical protein
VHPLHVLVSMSVSGLSRQVRSLLADSPDAPLSEVLLAADSFVLECSSSVEQDALLHNLDDELQGIHHDLVDHSSFRQVEVFLAVLYHLRPVLTATSVIVSTWFDLILRPALREPKLPTAAVNHAKELIICALENVSGNPEKVGGFRRRLLDLYLHDAFNEGSGEDIIEWADLDQQQRDKRAHWKSNLEDILVKYGLERPVVSFGAQMWPIITLTLRNPGLLDRNKQLLFYTVLASSTSYVFEYLHLSTIIPNFRIGPSDTPVNVESYNISYARQFVHNVYNSAHSACQAPPHFCRSCFRRSQASPPSTTRNSRSHNLLERASAPLIRFIHLPTRRPIHRSRNRSRS